MLHCCIAELLNRLIVRLFSQEFIVDLKLYATIINMLKSLDEFQKIGFWLAVVSKNNTLKVVAAAKKPEKALALAKKKGFKEASLMMSSNRYASWIP